jgi:hypothetical protein
VSNGSGRWGIYAGEEENEPLVMILELNRTMGVEENHPFVKLLLANTNESTP